MAEHQGHLERPLADQQEKLTHNADPTEHVEPTDQSAILSSGGVTRLGKCDDHDGDSPSTKACISAVSFET